MALYAVKNEKELLIAVSKGHQQAFAELFQGYHNQLGEYILLLVANDQLAKEIVQDVFVKIWLNRESLPTIKNFSGYLFILTRNYVLNCLRRQVNERKQMEAFKWDTQNQPLTEIDYLPVGYEKMMDRAIAQLPPQQLTVFHMKKKGKTNSEIAKEMGISPESVKKYHQWAIRAIANFVKKYGELTTLLLGTILIR